jgi:hypothetical protein
MIMDGNVPPAGVAHDNTEKDWTKRSKKTLDDSPSNESAGPSKGPSGRNETFRFELGFGNAPIVQSLLNIQRFYDPFFVGDMSRRLSN